MTVRPFPYDLCNTICFQTCAQESDSETDWVCGVVWCAEYEDQNIIESVEMLLKPVWLLHVML